MKAATLDMTKICRKGSHKGGQRKRGAPPTRYTIAEALREDMTDEQVSYSNLKPELRHRNYRLDDGRSTKEIMEWLIAIKEDPASAGQRAIRSDSPDLFAFVIYPPEGWEFSSEEDERQFFVETLDFTNSRFGAQNLAYACVHKDQGRGHMQLAYLPRTASGQWSSKYAAEEAGFKTLQRDYWQAVCRKWGMPKPEKATRPHFTKKEYVEYMQQKEAALAKIAEEVISAREEATETIRQAQVAQTLNAQAAALLREKTALVVKLLKDADRISEELRLSADQAKQYRKLLADTRSFLQDAQAVLPNYDQTVAAPR